MSDSASSVMKACFKSQSDLLGNMPLRLNSRSTNKSHPSLRTRRRSLPHFNALNLWHVHDIMAATSGKENNQRFAIRREGGEFRVRNRVSFVAARANLNWAEWTGLQQLPQLVRIHAGSILQPSNSFKPSMKAVKADRLKFRIAGFARNGCPRPRLFLEHRSQS